MLSDRRRGYPECVWAHLDAVHVSVVVALAEERTRLHNHTHAIAPPHQDTNTERRASAYPTRRPRASREWAGDLSVGFHTMRVLATESTHAHNHDICIIIQMIQRIVTVDEGGPPGRRWSAGPPRGTTRAAACDHGRDPLCNRTNTQTYKHRACVKVERPAAREGLNP